NRNKRSTLREMRSAMSRAAWSEAQPANISPPRRVRRPAVETIAGWSARHRKTAVFGWLALGAVAYLIGQLLGSPRPHPNHPQPAAERPRPGGAGRAAPAAPRRDNPDGRGRPDPGPYPGANVRD